MNQPITVSDKLKKRIITYISVATFVVLLLLLRNLVTTYSLSVAIVVILVFIIAVIAFNHYLWNKMSQEYIMIGATYIEWNGLYLEWEFITEIRIRKEKDKPMFLVLKEVNQYHRIPLRLFEDKANEIIDIIKELGLKIAD